MYTNLPAHLTRVRGGAIINIGGLTEHKGATGRAHAIAAKAGIAGLTRALALDLAPHRIAVNCVVPETIETVRGLPDAPPRPQDRRALPQLGRRGEPVEVAGVRMLCGPDARYITGQTVHVNRGRLHAVTGHRMHPSAGAQLAPSPSAERPSAREMASAATSRVKRWPIAPAGHVTVAPYSNPAAAKIALAEGVSRYCTNRPATSAAGASVKTPAE